MMTTITVNHKKTYKHIFLNPELIATIISGVFIAAAFFAEYHDKISFAVALYLLAFTIGGFAKAKEGFEETIKEKSLNVELLMIFAAIGSALIGYWAEGAILIFIFSLSGALESYTLQKSHQEISTLIDLKPEKAWLLTKNGQTKEVPVSSLHVGAHILIKPGESIPIDGIIIDGSSSINEAAITGESIPTTKKVGHDVFAGTMNMSGVITVEMTKPSSETLFQKIINLVISAQSEKSPSQQFIERFESAYVNIVLCVVALMMFLPHFLLGWDWTTTFYRAMVLLVVASPCALVASIMPATLAAISNGAKKGVLFKGGLHAEHVGSLKAIAFDKTGTLTKGKPVVTDFIVRDGVDENDTLQTLARIESQSNHPLAVAITSYAKQQGITKIERMTIEDVPGWGIQAVEGEQTYKVGKPEFVGKEEATQFANGIAATLAEEGKTVIFLRDEREILALVALKDTLRPEAVETIAHLKKAGIYTILLTGDNEKTAKVVAQEVGIDTYVAECLPEDKVHHLKQLTKKYTNVGMVGDGINDAPALATATTGVAMGDGTGVALETADVVLMKNDLTKITYSLALSKKMNRIIKQNIFFSVAVIILLIAGNFMQAVDLPLGVIGHEGSTILVILNGLRMLKN